jgi:hypothetical protein
MHSVASVRLSINNLNDVRNNFVTTIIVDFLCIYDLYMRLSLLPHKPSSVTFLEIYYLLQ